MKKLIIAILIFVGSFGYANAQTKAKTVHKKATTTAAATNAKEAKTTEHLKKDGTADKRFKENKTKAKGPMKKNGTPDMRYKANKK